MLKMAKSKGPDQKYGQAIGNKMLSKLASAKTTFTHEQCKKVIEEVTVSRVSARLGRAKLQQSLLRPIWNFVLL